MVHWPSTKWKVTSYSMQALIMLWLPFCFEEGSMIGLGSTYLKLAISVPSCINEYLLTIPSASKTRKCEFESLYDKPSLKSFLQQNWCQHHNVVAHVFSLLFTHKRLCIKLCNQTENHGDKNHENFYSFFFRFQL